MEDFLRIEAEGSVQLVPLERRLLEMGARSYLDLCERLEEGEDLLLDPFICVLRNMQQILDRIPPIRWAVLRSSVRKIAWEVDDRMGSHEKRAQPYKDYLVKKRAWFVLFLQNPSPEPDVEKLQQAKRIARKNAQKLKEEVEKRATGNQEGAV